MRNIEIKNEIDEIKDRMKKLNKKELKYVTNKYTYNFQQYERIRPFADYNGKINIDEAEKDKSNLLENLAKLNNKSRPRSKRSKEKKRYL